VRWELVPPGAEAAAVPGAGAGAPLGVYRERIRDDRIAMDEAADVVHADAIALQDKPRAPATACPCNPSVDGPCQAKELTTLATAGVKASEMVAKAKDAIRDYRQNPADPANEKAAKALRTHFRWTEALRQKPLVTDVPASVESLIDAILSGLTSALCAGCSDKAPIDPVEGKKVSAFTLGTWAKTNCFNVMRPFYFDKLTPAQRAKSVVHELAHNRGAAISDQGGYEGDANYPGGSANLAARNADSYANFTRDASN